MQFYKLGDIAVANIPFTDLTGIKLRPVIILKNTNDNDVIIARITSNLLSTPYDFFIQDWTAANLHKPSIIRLHKIVTINESIIRQTIGKLTQNDLQRLILMLNSFWSL